MIISVNPKPSLESFKKLMENTDQYLNLDAEKRHSYYKTRRGSLLEDDVKLALEECAKGTPFENTIEKISGQRFPDIVAAKYYGVEVKSTKDDNWKSTGSSILESTRVNDVERIFMTFGKLGGNRILFKSKPYEECLYGIAVTHMPRYLIDMRLNKGDTIFDKIGITYDELRKMENPIAPVSKYYRNLLKPGESLWWAGDAVDQAVSPTIRLWKNIPSDEKKKYIVFGCLNFPEIFRGDYDRYSLWLTSQGVVDSHIRDQFSSGGKETMLLSDGNIVDFPGVYRRVKNNMEYFIHLISIQESILFENVSAKGLELQRRLWSWCDSVSKQTSVDYEISMDALSVMFFGESANTIRQLLSTKPGEFLKTCPHCGNAYRQRRSKQKNDFKITENDICPYCNESNGSSTVWNYDNYK